MKILFSLGEQLPDKCQATEGVSPAAASVSLAGSSGNFIGNAKMARGSVRAQLPTSSQVAYQPLLRYLKKKKKKKQLGSTSKVEDWPKKSCSVRTIWAILVSAGSQKIPMILFAKQTTSDSNLHKGIDTQILR